MLIFLQISCLDIIKLYMLLKWSKTLIFYFKSFPNVFGANKYEMVLGIVCVYTFVLLILGFANTAFICRTIIFLLQVYFLGLFYIGLHVLCSFIWEYIPRIVNCALSEKVILVSQQYQGILIIGGTVQYGMVPNTKLSITGVFLSYRLQILHWSSYG